MRYFVIGRKLWTCQLLTENGEQETVKYKANTPGNSFIGVALGECQYLHMSLEQRDMKDMPRIGIYPKQGNKWWCELN